MTPGNSFENVTPINTRSMHERVFVLGANEAEFAHQMLVAWRMQHNTINVTDLIVDTVYAVAPVPKSLTERMKNERRIKLLSIIEHEEQIDREHDGVIDKIVAVLKQFEYGSPYYDATYAVMMMYRAQLDSDWQPLTDPMPLVERIVKQFEAGRRHNS